MSATLTVSFFDESKSVRPVIRGPGAESAATDRPTGRRPFRRRFTPFFDGFGRTNCLVAAA